MRNSHFPPSPCYSLWVQFVQRAVHPHRDVQVVQSAVLADLFDDGGHTSAAELGGAVWHGAAHLLHDYTVVTSAVQTQVLQDGPHLQQCQSVTRDHRDTGIHLQSFPLLVPTNGQSAETKLLKRQDGVMNSIDQIIGDTSGALKNFQLHTTPTD